MKQITCAACKTVFPFHPDRRQICLQCGEDFGRVLKRPLKIEVSDKWESDFLFLLYLIEDAAKEV